ncbi:MAG: hypothetical protein GY863_19290 [bacterium]|nr:hypothetical protein [bacterium]
MSEKKSNTGKLKTARKSKEDYSCGVGKKTKKSTRNDSSIKYVDPFENTGMTTYILK